MRILIVDNNILPDCWGTPDLRKYGTLAPGASLHVRRGPHDDLPRSARRYDRVVLSGSLTSCLADAPWISSLHELVRSAANDGKPLLGVCFGHQTIARALGGMPAVRKGTRPEFGWSEIEVTGESPILEGLPRTFHSFSSHFEEVAEAPAGFRVVARSEACAIQAFAHSERPIYGIQFHPEKDLTDADRIIEDRKKKGDRNLLHPERSRKLYDPGVGETIFRNFFRA